jgi:hypothetical protein
VAPAALPAVSFFSEPIFHASPSTRCEQRRFLQNIECSLYSDDKNVFSTLDAWFEKLFSDDSLTKQLREPDIRRYKKRFDAAKLANKAVKQLQREAEDDIGEQHHAGLGMSFSVNS